ncbi:hypothetical protein EYF80_013369 [Liparis tanakae]|uniref:Uncharacterized protein n=1 Tax=Liparis tanakae TaxID=230148 RepID=A0A4Z2IGF4_9TELE|nr:hypothetical protein EYF80_013369 [Liparis tanakae]
MCHDVGCPPYRAGAMGGGSDGHQKSTGTRSWPRKRLTQIDGGRENEAADEEMERDADRRGESDSDEERERERERERHRMRVVRREGRGHEWKLVLCGAEEISSHESPQHLPAEILAARLAAELAAADWPRAEEDAPVREHVHTVSSALSPL